MEGQAIYIGKSGRLKIHGADKMVRKISLKDATGVVRTLALWGEYADSPMIAEGYAMTTVACISGIRYDPDQGYSTTRRYVQLLTSSQVLCNCS